MSSGTYYLQARYYSPITGRFLAADTHWNTHNSIYGNNSDETPIPNFNAIMQSNNLYVYCMNNPIRYIDFTGNEAVTPEEIWNALKIGPRDAITIYNTKIKATTLADEYAANIGLSNATDNIADAYRHFASNYMSVKAGIPVDQVSSVMTKHEEIYQSYVGKDANGAEYYKIPLSTLMDLTNNQIGRYQATLEKNNGKDALEVFEGLPNGGVITSIEQTMRVFGIEQSWIIQEENYVVIQGGLTDDFLKLKPVNKDVLTNGTVNKCD